MSSDHFEKHLPSAREKSSANILSIIVIFFGTAALVFLISPR